MVYDIIAILEISGHILSTINILAPDRLIIHFDPLIFDGVWNSSWLVMKSVEWVQGKR